jgi:hypothetical protein
MSPLPSAWKNIGIMISRELAYQQILFGAKQPWFPQPTTTDAIFPDPAHSRLVTPE